MRKNKLGCNPAAGYHDSLGGFCSCEIATIFPQKVTLSNMDQISSPAAEITPAAIISQYTLSPNKAEALRCLLSPVEELQSLWKARVAIEEEIKLKERALIPVKSKCSGDCSGCSAIAVTDISPAKQVLSKCSANAQQKVYIDKSADPFIQERKLNQLKESIERFEKAAPTPPTFPADRLPEVDPKRFDEMLDAMPYVSGYKPNSGAPKLSAKLVIILLGAIIFGGLVVGPIIQEIFIDK